HEEAARREAERRHGRLSELAIEAEGAAGDPDPVAARRRLEVARREWKDLSTGIVVDEELARRFTAAEHHLAARETAARDQEQRDVADWQRWANVGIQEQLCEKMEALKTVDDPETVARHVRELQQEWRQSADVPRAQGEALWKRFKAAHDEVWARCEAHFAE